MHYVYFIKSCIKDRYYIGSTSDVHRRLLEHNSGSTKSTKPYMPWKLVYMEKYQQKSDATKREWHLKHPKGYLEKLEIVAKINQKHGEVA